MWTLFWHSRLTNTHFVCYNEAAFSFQVPFNGVHVKENKITVQRFDVRIRWFGCFWIMATKEHLGCVWHLTCDTQTHRQKPSHEITKMKSEGWGKSNLKNVTTGRCQHPQNTGLSKMISSVWSEASHTDCLVNINIQYFRLTLHPEEGTVEEITPK